jgi:rhamnulokinase
VSLRPSFVDDERMSGADFAAVDLGASSGRVVLGHVEVGVLDVSEINRFANIPVLAGGTLHWDILRLHRGVLEGLRAAGGRADQLRSVGIDSWAVDYGLLDESGALLGNPVHYRDRRTHGVMERVLKIVAAEQLYDITGIAQLPFNTVYQLVSAIGSPQLGRAHTMLMIPDLLTYWLTGGIGAEVTNASTTALYDVGSRSWSKPLIAALGLPERIFPPLRQPGSGAGLLLPEVLETTGQRDPVEVVSVGSHDTASAVVGVPAGSTPFAYISCGTWSLVGLELDGPVVTAASREANFTNESGVDGTVRFLRNVMGLWLLQECLRAWEEAGLCVDLDTVVRGAASAPAFAAVVDADDPSFLPFGDMPARIAAACRATGQRPPSTPEETVRCIVDSLALAYRATLQAACELSGRDVDAVHIVGGGVRNELLCQLTADACGVPVIAGPVEAAAIGNVLVQARAAGVVAGGLAQLRALTRATQPLRRYEPRANGAQWAEAALRIKR